MEKRSDRLTIFKMSRIGSENFPEALPVNPDQIGLIYVTHLGCKPCEVATPWVEEIINKYPDRVKPFLVSASSGSYDFKFFYDTLNVRGSFAVILYGPDRNEAARFVRAEDKKALFKKVEEMLGKNTESLPKRIFNFGKH